jgi:hypothetical protein
MWFLVCSQDPAPFYCTFQKSGHHYYKQINSVLEDEKTVKNQSTESQCLFAVPETNCLQTNQNAFSFTMIRTGNRYKKGKAIPVTGRRGPQGCETSRLTYFPDNRLIDGGEVVILTLWPPLTPRKIPATHFCRRLSRHQGHNAATRIKSIQKIQ